MARDRAGSVLIPINLHLCNERLPGSPNASEAARANQTNCPDARLLISHYKIGLSRPVPKFDPYRNCIFALFPKNCAFSKHNNKQHFTTKPCKYNKSPDYSNTL
jgi:hypothetical protein